MSKTPLFMLVALFMLAGCSDTPSAPVATDYPYIGLAPTEPPDAPPEAKQYAEDPMHYVWRSGHWVFNQGNYSWAAGEFLLRPSPTAVWAGDQWEEREYGWAFIPGHWE